jgi:tetratricopeptide (TPR) repeat protein
VTHSEVETPFTLKRVQEMLGLSRTTVTGLIAAGFVSPVRGQRNEHRFSFQDLMLLRTAYALQQARIPPRKILRSLAKLKAALPAELPLTGLRITAVGADVAVRDRSGQWHADSGQLLMDFEVADVGGTVSFIQSAPTAAPPQEDDWFRKGEALEATDRSAAVRAYRRAIELEPTRVAPYLNLGAVLCEDSRFAEAVELYDVAAKVVGDEPLIHFNHAIALEDQGRPRDALAAYDRALALDASFADAHYNRGVLLEKLGDARGALRHFNAYRRLQRD